MANSALSKGIYTVGGKYVRRTVAVSDYQLGDLTTDATWRELDLSSIVPVGAVAISLNVTARSTLNNELYQIVSNEHVKAFIGKI